MRQPEPEQPASITITRQFAMLAPVPEFHLLSGQASCSQHGKVAFGSMAWEFFGKLEELRQGEAVPVLIYASHAEERSLNTLATWSALYIGYVHSRMGRYPGDTNKYRPPSTVSDRPDWVVYWEVQHLRPIIGNAIAIADLQGWGKRQHYKPRFTPEGPMLIETSSTFIRWNS